MRGASLIVLHKPKIENASSRAQRSDLFQTSVPANCNSSLRRFYINRSKGFRCASTASRVRSVAFQPVRKTLRVVVDPRSGLNGKLQITKFNPLCRVQRLSGTCLRLYCTNQKLKTSWRGTKPSVSSFRCGNSILGGRLQVGLPVV